VVLRQSRAAPPRPVSTPPARAGRGRVRVVAMRILFAVTHLGFLRNRVDPRGVGRTRPHASRSDRPPAAGRRERCDADRRASRRAFSRGVHVGDAAGVQDRPVVRPVGGGP
jgi:hypothetical protein